MNSKNMSKLQKLTVSAMMMALYVVVMYFTQGFSFGEYQIRIATSLYAMAYFYPFLILPLGLANLMSNLLFGGLGLPDIIGGFIVGVLTSAVIAFIQRKKWSPWFTVAPILLIPGLGASVWLSYLLNVPYGAMAISLCIGQAIPAVCGALLIKALCRIPAMRGTIK